MSNPAVKTALETSTSLDTISAPRSAPPQNEQLREGEFSFKRPVTEVQKSEPEPLITQRVVTLPNSTTYNLDNAPVQKTATQSKHSDQKNAETSNHSSPTSEILISKSRATPSTTVLDRLMNWLAGRIEQLVRFLAPTRQKVKVRKKLAIKKNVKVGSIMADAETIAAVRGASQTNLSHGELDLIIAGDSDDEDNRNR